MRLLEQDAASRISCMVSGCARDPDRQQDRLRALEFSRRFRNPRFRPRGCRLPGLGWPQARRQITQLVKEELANYHWFLIAKKAAAGTAAITATGEDDAVRHDRSDCLFGEKSTCALFTATETRGGRRQTKSNPRPALFQSDSQRRAVPRRPA